MSFTVGFDLDMTLIDPRAGIVEVFDVLAAESGIPLDGRAFVTRLGPPLRHEFVRYDLDETTIEQLIDRYRALTPAWSFPHHCHAVQRNRSGLSPIAADTQSSSPPSTRRRPSPTSSSSASMSAVIGDI